MNNQKEIISEEDVTCELERVSILLDTDPEIINSMTIEEIEEEMLEEGMVPKRLPKSIRDKISPPKTLVVGVGGSNRKAGTLSDEEIAQRRYEFRCLFDLPLIVWSAAVVVLTTTIAPVFHELIFEKMISPALSLPLSLTSGIVISALVTMMIGYKRPDGQNKVVNRMGLVLGLALTIGGGILWVNNANAQSEVACAATLTALGTAVIIFLERVAATLRPALAVQPAAPAFANSVRVSAIKEKFQTAVTAVTGVWQRLGELFLDESKGMKWVSIASAGFLIFAASGGVVHWQYHASKTNGQVASFNPVSGESTTSIYIFPISMVEEQLSPAVVDGKAFIAQNMAAQKPRTSNASRSNEKKTAGPCIRVVFTTRLDDKITPLLFNLESGAQTELLVQGLSNSSFIKGEENEIVTSDIFQDAMQPYELWEDSHEDTHGTSFEPALAQTKSQADHLGANLVLNVKALRLAEARAEDTQVNMYPVAQKADALSLRRARTMIIFTASVSGNGQCKEIAMIFSGNAKGGHK